MSTGRQSYLQDAAKYWKQGIPLEAGRLLFENLRDDARAHWAARILQSVVKKSRVTSPSIDRVLQIAQRSDRWVEAHDAFSMVRSATLELSGLPFRSSEQSLLLQHLGLAELVAKVLYNATKPEDEFDADSGWWIAVCAKNIVDLLADDQFEREIWSELCGEGENGVG